MLTNETKILGIHRSVEDGFARHAASAPDVLARDEEREQAQDDLLRAINDQVAVAATISADPDSRSWRAKLGVLETYYRYAKFDVRDAPEEFYALQQSILADMAAAAYGTSKGRA